MSRIFVGMSSCCLFAVSAWGGVRTETLSDGWLFRRETEPEMRVVKVPHDWGVDYGFDLPDSCGGQGDLPCWGKGFYRRDFDGFAPPAGGRTYLTLDGVQCRSVIKLNGQIVGGRPFGYASETIDVTGFLKPSGNVLEVEASNTPWSSRWYSGSGVFRDVTVRVCPADHVLPNTLFVRTVEATKECATVAVSFEWRGGVSNFTFKVENPRLWSPEDPALYELELFGEKFRYGIRKAEFVPAAGFFLNGKHRQMRGVCMHHDLGPIGAAFDRDFARRQLTLLKEMGCDAIRTSHNPPAAALLDLCDELGVMVLNEAFDMWELPKGDYSASWAEWHARDLAEFVRRDWSHPCVVMWSIGNELREHDDPSPERPIRIATELTAIVKANDPTRPVTFGSWNPNPMWNGCQKTVDAFGANYLPFKYAEFREKNPEIGLVGTETSSCVSSRGEYFFPIVASPIAGEGDLRRRRDEGRKHMVRGGQMSGYDLWGPHPNDYPPDVEFEHQDRNPQVYGEFVWTGFDYLGEPDPCSGQGGRSSYFGIFDLAGLPKDRFWLYQAHWRPELPTAHLLPHWTWPGREGEVTPVHVYSSGDEAELFVNGVSQGRKRRGKYEYRFVWNDVRYQPGEIRVKTWRNGAVWAEDRVRTAGEPVRVDRAERRFGRLTFVTFALKDAHGTVCPNADRPLTFSVKPGTRLVSLCNGDASSHENFKGMTMRTFHGLLVAAVEGDPEGLVLGASVAEKSESMGLPDWAEARIGEAVARFEEWKGTDETIAFTFMSDVHSPMTNIGDTADFSDTRNHVRFAQIVADRAGCDFLVDAGDHDFDNGCKSPEEALARMASVERVYRDYSTHPVLFCLGNHDHGPYPSGGGERPVSSALYGETFNGLAERHGFTLTFGANRSWGCYDVQGKRFRAIFCNTSDNCYYGVSQAQLCFIVRSLATLPSGWTAAVFCHYCMFEEIGHWKHFQQGGRVVNKAEFIKVLEDFAKERPNVLAGVFCGDSHFDNALEYHGVNWTISQGYGGVSPDNVPWGARTVGFDRSRDMLFELVAIKPKSGQFRIFRVGAGGAVFDRTCDYFIQPGQQ